VFRSWRQQRLFRRLAAVEEPHAEAEVEVDEENPQPED
jgi:hypothetical protein